MNLNADSSDDDTIGLTTASNVSLNADSSEDESCVTQPHSIGVKNSEKTIDGIDSSDDESLGSTILGKKKVVKKKNPGSPSGKSSSKNTELDSSDEEASVTQTVKKSTRIVDSTDDEEEAESFRDKGGSSGDEDDNITKSSRKKKITSKILDSDSSDDDKENQKRSLLSNKELYDAESSDENDDLSTSRPNQSRMSGSSDNEESSQQRSPGQSDEEEAVSRKETPVKQKKSYARKSKSSAIDEIRSESQRMLRESRIGLSYHKPKQRSLQEFLDRKKGTPEIINSIKIHNFSSADQVAIDERQKKIEEFYKNEESVDEDEDIGQELRAANETSVPPEVTSVEQDHQPETENHVETRLSAVDSTTASEVLCDESLENSQVNTGKASHSLSETTSTAGNLENVPDSLNLVLEESQELDNTVEPLETEQVKKKTKRELKLEALKKHIEAENLEKTLNITPKLGSSKDHELEEGPIMSSGVKSLFDRFVVHARANGPPKLQKTKDEDLNIVTKKVNKDGQEVLELKTVHVTRKDEEIKDKPSKISARNLKSKLKQEMIDRKLEELEKRKELSKLNNEQFDEVLSDENFDEELDENEDYDDDEEKQEDSDSEPEENDIILKDKPARRGLFADDEAEESGNEDDEADEDSEDDTGSLNLVQEEDDQPKRKTKSDFSKIRNPNLLSDDSNSIGTPLPTNTIESETPNTETASVHSMAGSTASSTSSFFNTVPRWTPFKDRLNTEGTEMSLKDDVVRPASPTESQIAKKKLGFEGLFDASDPEVDGLDDVVGLCSGKFATQVETGDNNDIASFAHPLPTKDNMEHSETFETQDTVILTGNQRTDEVSELDSLLGLGSKSESLPDNQLAPGFMEDNLGAGRILDSDDEAEELVPRKRKRAVISDDEESDKETLIGNLSNDEEADSSDDDDEDVAAEDETNEPKLSLFDKKGRLKKDFLENEAELSGSDDEFEDEDERGLDRLEMEEGDLDEIDEEHEMDKVGRIHQKVLLDEDQAEIRLFQERFLEDGDLHTDNKRQRQYRWKGLDQDIQLDKQESDEEEEEEIRGVDDKWRQERLEREKWMKENNSTEKSSTEPESQIFKLAEKALVNNLSKTSSKIDKRTGISRTGPLQPLSNRDSRNSFLARDQSSLAKITGFNKKTDDRSGAGAKKSARNFVFAALSPEKAAGPEIDSNVDQQPTKKEKKVPPAKRTKLDRSLKGQRATIFNLL